MTFMVGQSSVTVLSAVATLLLAAVAFPMWKPLLVAAVLAGALRPVQERLTGALGSRRTLSAALVTAGAVLVVLVPLLLLGLVVIKQAVGLIAFLRQGVGQRGWARLLAPLPDSLERRATEALASWSAQHRSLASLVDRPRTEWALGKAGGLVGSVGHLVYLLALLLVALFFLLRDGRALVEWGEQTAPMPPGQFRSLLSELKRVSGSVIGAQLASGLVQSVVATVGYVISGVPSPILFGALTLPASLIPTPGTAIVGLPLAGLLWVMGRSGWAIFLAAWTTVVTGLIDNVVRPNLVRGGTDLNGALIFFSFLGGLLTFGPMGLIVGPLALVLFVSVAKIRRQERDRTSS
jgi:predicted PurR-regulated permease PerM